MCDTKRGCTWAATRRDQRVQGSDSREETTVEAFQLNGWSSSGKLHGAAVLLPVSEDGSSCEFTILADGLS